MRGAGEPAGLGYNRMDGTGKASSGSRTYISESLCAASESLEFTGDPSSRREVSGGFIAKKARRWRS